MERTNSLKMQSVSCCTTAKDTPADCGDADPSNIDRCKTPPCFPFPPKRGYNFEPVLAPIVVRIPSVPKKKRDNENFMSSLYFSPFNVESNRQSESQQEWPQNSNRPVNQDDLNADNLKDPSGHGAIKLPIELISSKNGNDSGGKTPKKRGESESSGLRTDNMLGAFKSVKFRKQE